MIMGLCESCYGGHESGEVRISSVELEEGTEQCYINAQQALDLAVQRHRAGGYYDAFRLLADAEQHLTGDGVTQRPPALLLAAFHSDPDIQAIRDSLIAMDNCLAQAEECSPEQLEATMNSAAEEVFADRAPGKPETSNGRAMEEVVRTRSKQASKIAMEEVVRSRSMRPSMTGADSEMRRTVDLLSITEAVTEAPLAENRKPSKENRANMTKFANVVGLCEEVRVFEAVAALKAVEVKVASTYQLARVAKRTDLLDEICGLAARCGSDPVFVKLRAIHGRMEQALGPQGLLTQSLRGADSDWIIGEIRDPSIGEHFKCEFRIRFAKGEEVEKDGETSQLIARATVSNWPQSLQNWVALERETDLCRKEYVQDCKSVRGTPGGPEQMMSAMLNAIVRPMLMPFKFDAVMARDFSVCADGQIPGFPRAVLQLEQSLPKGEREFEGWTIPPEKWGNIRVSSKIAKVFVPSTVHVNCSTMVLGARIGVPLPKSMVPLGMLKMMMLDVFSKSFQLLKRQVLDSWGSTGYPARIEQARAFYGAVAALGSGGDAPSPCGGGSAP